MTSAPQRPLDLAERRRAHWRRNAVLTRTLLGVWFVLTFGVGWFADALDFPFFGWPFSFWIAAQGALLVYIAIIVFYAWRMNRLDREYGLGDEEG